MSAPNLRQFFDEKLEWVQRSYVEDLEALPESQLSFMPCEGGRTAYDVTYECVVVNRRIATRLRGEDPGPAPEGKWAIAPTEFQSPEVCIWEYRTSLDAVREAWKACPEERWTEPISLPNGGTTTALDLVYMVCFHCGYHDGQLNLFQCLVGDMDVHWT